MIKKSKMNIISEIYEMKKEIQTLQGGFQQEVLTAYTRSLENKTIAKLEAMVEMLQEELNEERKKAEIKAFYETEEGAAFKKDIETKIDTLSNIICEKEEKTKVAIDTLLKKHIGSNWNILHFGTTYISIGIVGKDSKAIFGQCAELYFGKDYFNEKFRFELNVGSCGSHDLLPEEREFSFAEFYVGIGKMYSDMQFLNEIQFLLKELSEQNNNARREVREFLNLLKNPLDK